MNRNRYSCRPLSQSSTDSGIALVLGQMLSLRKTQPASLGVRGLGKDSAIHEVPKYPRRRGAFEVESDLDDPRVDLAGFAGEFYDLAVVSSVVRRR